MKTTKNDKNWRIYERFIAAMHIDHASNELTVVPNARLVGCISGVGRQIDLLIDARVEEDVSRRIIIDAKLRRRKIDIKDVESFEGMMKDCRAHRGILVCPHGYTKAALRRSQDLIIIKLVTLDELDSFNPSDWELCVGQCSLAKSRFKDQGWVLFDSQMGIITSNYGPASIVAIGKCDVCNDFNIHCWECGKRFALMGDEAEYKCDCDRFWLTAIEEEGIDHLGNSLNSVVLIVVSLYPESYQVVDRRPLQ